MGIELAALAGAGAGAGLIGAKMSAKAAKEAANTQAEAANHATEVQRQIYEQGRADLAPWREAGAESLGVLQRGMYSPMQWGQFNRQFETAAPEYQTFTLNDFQTDPGYQFRMAEGQRGLERSAAARGGLLSGGALRSLERYRQGVASDEYGNALQRFNNDQTQQYARWGDAYNRFYGDQDRTINRLSALAGVGQNATNTGNQMAANYGTQAGNNMMQAANAQAAGKIGGAQAYGNALNNITNMAFGAAGMMAGGGFGGTGAGAGAAGAGTAGTMYGLRQPSPGWGVGQ